MTSTPKPRPPWLDAARAKGWPVHGPPSRVAGCRRVCRGRIGWAALWLLAGLACESPPSGRAGPGGEAHVAEATAVELVFAPECRARIGFGPRRQRVRGELPLATGTLQLDAASLADSRGQLTFDLGRLSMVGEDEDYTEQSTSWLELSPQLGGDRFARFHLTSLGQLTAQTPAAGHPQPAPGPGQIARRVDFSATGELLLHGVSTLYTAPLRATFHLADDPGHALQAVVVETRSPYDVDLVVHEVKPRDAAGNVVAAEAARLYQGRLRLAEVRFRCRAVATSVGGQQPDAP